MLSRGQKTSRLLVRYNDTRAVFKIASMLLPVFYKKPNKLKDVERTFCYIVLFDQLIDEKGFIGFYESEAADHTLDIYYALESITNTTASKVIYDSMAPFKGLVPKTVLERKLFIKEHSTECLTPWVSLTSDYMNIRETLLEELLEFIRDHILEFR